MPGFLLGNYLRNSGAKSFLGVGVLMRVICLWGRVRISFRGSEILGRGFGGDRRIEKNWGGWIRTGDPMLPNSIGIFPQFLLTVSN